MRDIHMVHKVGIDVVAKLLYYDWGTDTAESVKEFIDTKNLNMVDVSNYKVIDSLCSTRHTVVLDGDEGNNFILPRLPRHNATNVLAVRKV